MCEFQESNCKGFGDMWWTDKCTYFSSIESGFDRRHVAEAALAMREVMAREEEPSFVIKDPRYVKESTNCTSLLHIFNGRWLAWLG